MSDWRTRLIEERDQLEDKMEKLSDFLDADPDLGEEHMSLLLKQYDAMLEYDMTLNKRLRLTS